MKLGSLFDGAGTFPFAGQQYGIKPCWASEIESFPISVTKQRFPKMVHLGDITKVSGADIEPVDVITFGSPCQDLSVAGKQVGLSGERSGLFMEAIRIIKEMRGKTNGKYPRYAVWENVPGAFSSNDKEDFRTVLEELCKVKDNTANVPRPTSRGGSQAKWQSAGLIMADEYSIAWRVLDAQFCGVPQRRRRIFLVADFRGQSAGQILFERNGLSRNFAESRKAWKGITTDTTYGFNQSGKCFDARGNGNGNYPPPIISLENHPADSRITIEEDGNIQTLTSRMGTGGGNVPMLLVGFDMYNQEVTGNKTRTLKTPLGGDDLPVIVGIDTYNQDLTGDKAKSLLAGHMDCDGLPCVAINISQDPVPNSKVSPCLSTGNPITGQANIAICMATQQGGAEIAENLCPTITAAAGMSGNNQPIVCLEVKDKIGTLCVRDYKTPNYVCLPLKSCKWVVRRVIPIECARLQGMPDWWCKDIPHSDSAEYKMWGNGMALPCAMYVIEGIALQLQREVFGNLEVNA